MRLSALCRARFAETSRLIGEVKEAVSDMQFTDAYRVPFQFSRKVQAHFKAGTFVNASSGVTITDLCRAPITATRPSA